MTNRKKIKSTTETTILTKSRRRCALCFGLEGDYSEKLGQIAHLDKDRSNDKLDNLGYLCFDHHSKYDSTSSQHKNYTITEVKTYREQLYSEMSKGTFENQKLVINDPSKPYSLAFDGVTSCFEYELKKDIDLTNLLIEAEFRISNQLYAGVLFCLIGTNRNYIYLFHYSAKHPLKPNYLEFKYRFQNEQPEVLFALSIDYSKWTTLFLSFEKDRISIATKEFEMLQTNSIENFKLKKINLGGTFWDIFPQNLESLRPSFLTSNFHFFKLIKNQELIENIEFSFGNEYLERTLYDKNHLFINAPSFEKIKTDG